LTITRGGSGGDSNPSRHGEKIDRKVVLSLPLMWIFRKRVFSVSKDFGFFLGKEKDDRPHGQIDLIEKKNQFSNGILLGSGLTLTENIIHGV